MTNSLSPSHECRALVEHFEELRLVAYRDEAGHWTIGYGHTPGRPGQRITEAQAEALLQHDMAAAAAAVNSHVRVPLQQHEYDALVSLAFNIGAGAFAGSTLLRRLNAGDRHGAAAQFLQWVHAGGHVSAGLVRRRRAEAAMFAGNVHEALALAAQ